MHECRKVLFLVSSLNAGGIENYLLRYLNFDNHNEAFVLCKSGMGGQLEPKYAAIIGGNIIKLKIGIIDPISWFRLYQVIRKNRITAVCDFTGEVSGISLLAAKLAGAKIRITFYRHSSFQFKITALRSLYIKAMKFLITQCSTKILSNSQTALNFYHPGWKDEPQKYKVIYNGISEDFINSSYSKEQVRKELGIPLDAFVVGHTGRLSPAKNHKTILAVAENICGKSPKVHFLIAGYGTDQLIEDNYPERIHRLGYRSDVGRLLAAMDLFYFPSLTEGQPNALIEAMVKDLAIVASDIEPIKETVPQVMIPELVPPMDFEIASAKILRAIDDEAYYQSLQCKDWAISHFNAAELFGLFEKELSAN